MDIDQTILYRYFDGKASSEDEEIIRRWLEAAPEHEKLFLQQRKIYDAILLNRQPKYAKRIFFRRNFYRELSKIAAVIVLTLGVSFFYYQNKTSKSENKYQTIYVPVGQHINLTLADGTNVWLNAQTKLQYPLSFGKKKRHVILDGEAYFKVTKNKKKPFIVQTDKYNIEVLGTEFNVEAYSDKKDFKTTLISGQVKINSNQNKSKSIVLKPKQMIYLDDGKLQIKTVSDFNSYRWKEGLICFKNASFTDITNAFEKYYGVTIQIENEEVKKRSYSGKFHQKDGIDYMLRVLQKDIDFTYKYDASNNTITIR